MRSACRIPSTKTKLEEKVKNREWHIDTLHSKTNTRNNSVPGKLSVAQLNKKVKNYWKMGEWKKLTANERQKIFYDHKNWNDGRKKSGNSGKETPYNKTETK